MSRTFLFDVDGTLTDARSNIDPKFEKFLLDFICKNNCMIVTGSDRPKTLEQIGLTLTNTFAKVYHCSGNHVYRSAVEIHRNPWQLTKEQIDFITQVMSNIDYPAKTGSHIEHRIGTANVSIVGRNANWEQRAEYVKWEKVHQKRKLIAETYNNQFKDSFAQIAGETSIDIYKTGCDKSQVIKHQKGNTIYFGDNCFPGGNDWSVSQKATEYYQITEGYKQTWELLKSFVDLPLAPTFSKKINNSNYYRNSSS